MQMISQMYLNSSHSFGIANAYAFSCNKEEEREGERKEKKMHSTACLLGLRAQHSSTESQGLRSPFPGSLLSLAISEQEPI